MFKLFLIRGRALLIGLVMGILLAFGLSVYAEWNPPPGVPPECLSGVAGCDAPLNVGNGAQAKKGSLDILGDFKVSGYFASQGGSGDMNESGGIIDINDITKLVAYTNPDNTIIPPADVLTLGDLNGDGKLSIDDAGIQMLFFGKDVSSITYDERLLARTQIGSTYGATAPGKFLVLGDADIKGNISVQGGSMHLTPQEPPTASPNPGDLYVNSTTSETPDELCFYDGVAWQGISSGVDANCN